MRGEWTFPATFSPQGRKDVCYTDVCTATDSVTVKHSKEADQVKVCIKGNYKILKCLQESKEGWREGGRNGGKEDEKILGMLKYSGHFFVR